MANDKQNTAGDRDALNPEAAQAAHAEADQAVEAAVDDILAADATAEAKTAATTAARTDQEMQAQLAEANQRALRIQADLDNYRKRARRELEEQTRYASLPLIRDLLPVIDNLQRAIDAAAGSDESGEAGNVDGLLQGVQMVVQQFHDVLAGRQCKQVEAAGQPFDPNYHEAILQQTSADHDPGTVIQVTQTGYQLFDRVIRPAQVIVAKAPEEA